MNHFFFQAEDGIRDVAVTGVQTCALPISGGAAGRSAGRGSWRPGADAQVPWVQDVRYARCSAVSSSVSTPIDASLRRALSASISRGTPGTFLARLLPRLSLYSAA